MTCDGVLYAIEIGALMLVGLVAVGFVVLCFCLGLAELVDRKRR